MIISVYDIIYIFFAAILLVSILILLFSLSSYSKAEKEKDIDKMKIAFRRKWLAIPSILYSLMVLVLNARFLSIRIGILSGDYLSILFFLGLMVTFPLIPYYIKFHSVK